MGGGSSKQKKQKTSKNQPAISKDWEVQTRTDNGAIYADKNGRQAEQYKYTLNNRYSPDHQFDIFEQRRTTTVPIVKSYGAQYNQAGSGLKPENQFRVLTQRIPHRLSQAPQLTYPESLYVLQQSLNGYSHLYDKTGSFHVTPEMIGFTPEGQTKVWMNDNFGQNHPSAERHILQSTLQDRNYLNNIQYNSPVNDDQAAMVRNIVQVVEDKCEEGKFTDENFRSQIYRDRVGFEEARNIVENTISSGKFARINKVDLYNHLVLWRTTGRIQNTSHIISKPEMITTTKHYQSNVKPVVTQVRTSNVRPIVTEVKTSNIQPIVYQPPPQPVVTSSYTTNTYTPYTGAKSVSNTKYLFNYQAPKEYFHPDMYAQVQRY